MGGTGDWALKSTVVATLFAFFAASCGSSLGQVFDSSATFEASSDSASPDEEVSPAGPMKVAPASAVGPNSNGPIGLNPNGAGSVDGADGLEVDPGALSARSQRFGEIVDSGSESSAIEVGCSSNYEPSDSEQLRTQYSVGDNGSLELCSGEESELLKDHWQQIGKIGNRADIDRIVSVALVSDIESPFSATVYPTAGDTFMLTVNEAEIDSPLLGVVLIHELSHVIQFTANQIELGSAVDGCQTPHENGCFKPGSYVDEWAKRFWPGYDLSTIGDGEAEMAQRCEGETGFASNYSTKHPTEDFADSLSYYVFDIRVPAGAQPRLDYFDDYPEFIAMRERAEQFSELYGKYSIEPESRCVF